MKTFICKICKSEVEIEATAKRRWYCPACLVVRLKELHSKYGARLKADSNSTRGVLNKAEKSRQFALRMASIAPYTRGETAKLLGVSNEQIRQDEVSIILKIRQHCAGLAAECGYKVT